MANSALLNAPAPSPAPSSIRPAVRPRTLLMRGSHWLRSCTQTMMWSSRRITQLPPCSDEGRPALGGSSTMGPCSWRRGKGRADAPEGTGGMDELEDVVGTERSRWRPHPEGSQRDGDEVGPDPTSLARAPVAT